MQPFVLMTDDDVAELHAELTGSGHFILACCVALVSGVPDLVTHAVAALTNGDDSAVSAATCHPGQPPLHQRPLLLAALLLSLTKVDAHMCARVIKSPLGVHTLQPALRTLPGLRDCANPAVIASISGTAVGGESSAVHGARLPGVLRGMCAALPRLAAHLCTGGELMCAGTLIADVTDLHPELRKPEDVMLVARKYFVACVSWAPAASAVSDSPPLLLDVLLPSLQRVELGALCSQSIAVIENACTAQF